MTSDNYSNVVSRSDKERYVKFRFPEFIFSKVTKNSEKQRQTFQNPLL